MAVSSSLLLPASQLLVSVSSVAEARSALAGGAALIDVKDPSRGSLGRMSEATISEVIRAVNGRRPVSAALGEMHDQPLRSAPLTTEGLSFVKWGLAGYFEHPTDWRDELLLASRHLATEYPHCQVVPVAYADWRQARSPAPGDVCRFACTSHFSAFLLDTWRKDGTTLLDWLTPAEILEMRLECLAAGTRLALAGSLGPTEIRQLRGVAPHWFAVRGAVCTGNSRLGSVDSAKVRQLVELLSEPVTVASSADSLHAPPGS